MSSEIWLDYSFARPNLKTAHRSGAVGVFRYLCPVSSSTAGKIVDVAEYHAILAAGLDVVLNFEWYSGRCLEGHAAGLADGKVAYEQARQLGYPKGATIVFSHDTGTRNDARVAAYLEGAQSQMHGYYNVEGNAVYSGIDTVDAMVARKAAVGVWQTLAWSNGRRSAHAHFYQNGRQWFGGGADENLRLRKDGAFVSHRDALAAAGHAVIPPKSHKPTPAKPSKPTKPIPAGGTYVVRSGDTLSKIAARHGVANWRTLAALNHLSAPYTIRVGQKLKLPGAKIGPGKVKPIIKKIVTPKSKRYTVRDHDTLSSIAEKFDTTWQRLRDLNHLRNVNLIVPGQVLRVR